MVEELRKIILSYDEVILALDAFRRVNAEFLPRGKILGWKPSGEAVALIQLEQDDVKDTGPKQYTLKATDFFEPAVKFCIANNIVLPRNSRKCIRIEKDRIALYIVIGSPEEATLCPPA